MKQTSSWTTKYRTASRRQVPSEIVLQDQRFQAVTNSDYGRCVCVCVCMCVCASALTLAHRNFKRYYPVRYAG